MPCPKCRPIFIEANKKYSRAAFRRFRVKYTEQHLELDHLRATIQQQTSELERQAKEIERLREALEEIAQGELIWASMDGMRGRAMSALMAEGTNV